MPATRRIRTALRLKMKKTYVAAAALLVGALAAIFSPVFTTAQSPVAETMARFGRFLHNDGMIGVVVDYALPTPPDGWLLCHGQALAADTPYQALRAKLIAGGSPYGSSGGNPLLPDARGRISAGVDNMGGTAANRLTAAAGGVNGAVIGSVGGDQTHTLTVAQMPSHGHGVTDPTHTHAVYDPTHDHAGAVMAAAGTAQSGSGKDAFTRSSQRTALAGTGVSIYGAYTGISIQANGSGAAHPNVQPTIVFNKIIFAGL